MCEGTERIMKERSVEDVKQADRKVDRYTVRQADSNEGMNECKEECARLILPAEKDVKK